MGLTPGLILGLARGSFLRYVLIVRAIFEIWPLAGLVGGNLFSVLLVSSILAFSASLVNGFRFDGSIGFKSFDNEFRNAPFYQPLDILE